MSYIFTRIKYLTSFCRQSKSEVKITNSLSPLYQRELCEKNIKQRGIDRGATTAQGPLVGHGSMGGKQLLCALFWECVYTYIYTYTYTHIYIYTYMCVCVYIFLFVLTKTRITDMEKVELQK